MEFKIGDRVYFNGSFGTFEKVYPKDPYFCIIHADYNYLRYPSDQEVVVHKNRVVLEEVYRSPLYKALEEEL